jgi:NAD(P)-dependent dehydrogenase (short-subunit alcohol dehydrogenase family)
MSRSASKHAPDGSNRVDQRPVNGVRPSVIGTPANRRAKPNADLNQWVARARTACVIRFLASEEASFKSGAVLPRRRPLLDEAAIRGIALGEGGIFSWSV